MRLIGNSLWNLVGGLVPAIAAFVTVPVVVSRLGEVHYGLLTLITSIVGYFALLDVNATTGSVKYLSEYHARRDDVRMRQVFSLGLALYLSIGLIGALGIVVFAEPLATRVFNVPAALHDTAVTALRFGGIAFFFGQVQSYLLSVPQALNRYDASARSEVVFGSLASVSTVLIVLAGGGLVEIMAARAAIAAANVAVLLRTAAGLLPGLAPVRPGLDVVRRIFGFSAYSYLSRFSAVTYANADKLLIGAYVDMRALAMYAVPFMLANRLFALTFRLGQVMLPEASRLDAGGEREQLRRTYLASARLLVFVNAGIACLLILLGREVLHHWAGSGFGDEATLVLVLVASAVFFDSFTNLPSLVNDGMGRPANTGIFAALRALVGLAAAWAAVQVAGIVGVAWAMLAVSMALGALFLAWVHHQVLPATLGEFVRHALLPSLLPWAVAAGVATATLHHEPLPLAWMLGLGLAATVLLAAYGWWVVMRPTWRVRVQGAMRRRLSAAGMAGG